jgi:hypothetical protein
MIAVIIGVEEKDFENVSIPHLSVQNKTARVQQKIESKLLKTKQSFNKSPQYIKRIVCSGKDQF